MNVCHLGRLRRSALGDHVIIPPARIRKFHLNGLMFDAAGQLVKQLKNFAAITGEKNPGRDIDFLKKLSD